MKFLNRNNWKALLLLSIIVPVGLFAVLGLTQLQTDTSGNMETVTLNPVTWEFEKPSFTTDIPLWFHSPEEACATNMYDDGFASITHKVTVGKYLEMNPSYDSPMPEMGLNVTASVTEGFVETVRMVFREEYNASQMSLWNAIKSSYFVTFENLTLRDWACKSRKEWLLNSDLKAFVETEGLNHPKGVFLEIRWVDWILRAPANLSQQLEITAEVTYFNGTSHIEVALPIFIRLIAEVGDTFETARTITAGTYIAGISAFHDPIDYYKIWLAKGEKIKILTILRETCISLTLFDINGEPRISINSGNYATEPKNLDEIDYMADMEGYWYIKVQGTYDQGTYKLTVEV